MIFTEKELEDILKQGENSSVEFKSASVRPEVFAREMVAFVNSNGGVILLGVSDSGDLEGLDLAKNYEEWTMNIARHNVSPALTVQYEELEIQGKKIGVISIEKGKDKPYQTGDHYFIRIGSTNRKATQAELLRLYQAAGVFHYYFDRKRRSQCGRGTSFRDQS
ncbi:MAG: ATP-binding protein [Candidatus Vecturithrix sp.]|jgi:ATP-dependent DNA helicase RecG|nr:ATP-binding protein [Candidatus Vecturithrix sp.]